MKKKEKQQLHAQNLSDVTKLIAEAEKKIREAARDRFTKPAKDVHVIKKLRKRLATLRTVAREKELPHA